MFKVRLQLSQFAALHFQYSAPFFQFLSFGLQKFHSQSSALRYAKDLVEVGGGQGHWRVKKTFFLTFNFPVGWTIGFIPNEWQWVRTKAVLGWTYLVGVSKSKLQMEIVFPICYKLNSYYWISKYVSKLTNHHYISIHSLYLWCEIILIWLICNCVVYSTTITPHSSLKWMDHFTHFTLYI